MVSKGFVGCTLGCLAGGGIEPNAAMLCLLSCYLVEIHDDSDDRDDDGDDANGDGSSETDSRSSVGPAS